jgi:hypothetical protein
MKITIIQYFFNPANDLEIIRQMHLLLPSPHACPQVAGLCQLADPETSLSVLLAADWRNMMMAFQYGIS